MGGSHNCTIYVFFLRMNSCFFFFLIIFLCPQIIRCGWSWSFWNYPLFTFRVSGRSFRDSLTETQSINSRDWLTLKQRLGSAGPGWNWPSMMGWWRATSSPYSHSHRCSGSTTTRQVVARCLQPNIFCPPNNTEHAFAVSNNYPNLELSCHQLICKSCWL